MTHKSFLFPSRPIGTGRTKGFPPLSVPQAGEGTFKIEYSSPYCKNTTVPDQLSYVCLRSSGSIHAYNRALKAWTISGT